MNPQESISYLCHQNWQDCKPGLSRIKSLLSMLGNPQKHMKYVHIAGTNGKGSTSAMVASVLRESGYCVGLYTSPCLRSFNERIRINGVMITDAEITELTEKIRLCCEKMPEHPTEFEMVTALAFLYFRQAECDIVVLETGMGGELDATNVIDCPEVAAITSIGLDHTQFLGDTVEKIAQTKSGIIKHGCDAVVYGQGDSIIKEIEHRCKEISVPMDVVDFSKIKPLSHSLEGQCFNFGKYKSLQIKLLGKHQLKNAAMAVKIIEHLISKGFRITEQSIRLGLARAKWEARFDILGVSPVFIADGGHNPQCVDTITETLPEYLPDSKPVFLVGVLADKDYKSMISKVVPLSSHFVTVTPENPRALSANELSEYISSQCNVPVTSCDSIQDGVMTAKKLAGPKGTVCAFGSLYMAGSILNCF